MNGLLSCLVLVASIPFVLPGGAGAEDVPPQRESATRLQIFLDCANFGPGKIDGRYGDFTRKALGLYRAALQKDAPELTADAPISKAVAVPEPSASPKPADLEGLDLASVDPVFIEYQVSERDFEEVGEMPKEVPEMAKLKRLPYASAAEAISEKFHCDLDFLKELNPEKLDSLKAGDTLKVPNVEPFEVSAVQETPSSGEKPGKEAQASELKITIDTKDSMLRLLERDKLIAAYPVTIGSERTQSPAGEWKVRSVARWPDFRYDRSFLDTGVRGEEAHLLPPGPNNLVGVIWIALDRPGIGIHGTSEPDTIGRSSSHGCIRMANWDVVRLAERVRAGVSVSIR